MDMLLTEIITDAASIVESIDADKLHLCTTYSSHLHHLPVHSLCHLHILDVQSVQHIRRLHDLGLTPGYYVSACGTWALALCVSEDISGILAQCTGSLELLDIRFSLLEELDVSHLTGLKTLNLSQNNRLRLLKGLEALPALESLDVYGTALSALPDVCHCPQLREINIGRTMISGMTVSRPHPNVRKLYASFSNIMGLEFLRHFPELTELYLWNCPVNDISAITGLRKLVVLDLSETLIQELPPLDGHHQLHTLELAGTHLSDPDRCIFPSSLQNLILTSSTISRIPESIRQLKEPMHLAFNDLNLEELPVWLVDLGLHVGRSSNDPICLEGTTVKDLDMSLFDQPWEMVEQWFAGRKQAMEESVGKPLNEMKIVFLGDGGAGKTHTITRLLADGEHPKDFRGDATPGILITDKLYHIDDRDVQVHFWDFGGQEILHSMHRMFLTNRTLYVVVLNVRDGTQDERARYWLHNLKHFARESPVLLVLNQMDQNENASINETDLRRLYPGMTDVVKMSAKNDSVVYFQKNFIDILKKQIANFENLESPFLPSWIRLKERLRTMEKHYIRGTEYNVISEECGVINSEDTRKALLNWFNDLGVSFCYNESEKLKDYMILRPDWITNAIYMILFNKMDNVENGLVPHNTLYQLLQNPSDTIKRVLPNVTYYQNEVEFVLNVVRKFRLSFVVDGEYEFIPMLCNSNTLDIATEYEMDTGTLEFRMEYEYLPNNVLHWLMVDLRSQLDKNNVWLTGARFILPYTGLSAVVKTGGNTLKIFTRSEQSTYPAQFYLNIIRSTLHEINRKMGIAAPKEKIAYKADGIVECFNYKQLEGTLKSGSTMIYSDARDEMISIQDILNQSDSRFNREREQLVQDILKICQSLQANRIYWNASENECNTFVRDMLRQSGYIVQDQTLSGGSATGKQAGELDLAIKWKDNESSTIYEALNIRSKNKGDLNNWNEHLQRLLDNYNPSGLPFLFLVSYVRTNKDQFSEILDVFSEHIRWYHPENYERRGKDVQPVLSSNCDPVHYLKAYTCRYDRSGSPTTVYHIFVRIGE